MPTQPPRVTAEDRGPVRVLTLNRADRHNAIDPAMQDALLDAFAQAATDTAVHVVLLAAAGPSFCAGADLADMAAIPGRDPGQRQAGRNAFAQLLALLESFPKPIVAAVHGKAIGFGFTVLGYCDFTFLAPDARLRTPFAQLGLSPEAASSYLFPLRMGWPAAQRALLLGEWFSAAEVVACGLGTAVAAEGALFDTALAFATDLAQSPLQSLVAIKQLMLAPHLPAMAAAREAEGQAMARLIGTPANRAAVQRFFARPARGAADA